MKRKRNLKADAAKRFIVSQNEAHQHQMKRKTWWQADSSGQQGQQVEKAAADDELNDNLSGDTASSTSDSFNRARV